MQTAIFQELTDVFNINHVKLIISENNTGMLIIGISCNSPRKCKHLALPVSSFGYCVKNQLIVWNHNKQKLPRASNILAYFRRFCPLCVEAAGEVW